MRSLRIGFTSPQGGAGVSTVTVAIASRLQYYHHKLVTVVDCDLKKHSCMSLREKDDMSKANGTIYEMYAMPPGEIGTVEDVNSPNTIFYDLGGNMDHSVLEKMDYVYIPVVQSHMLGNCIRTVLNTAEDFYKMQSETKFRLFMNKCKPWGPERLWDLVRETEITPCDQIMITEARIYRRQSLLHNLYDNLPAIPTYDSINFRIMKDAGIYNLEWLILKDIERPRLWKRQ